MKTLTKYDIFIIFTLILVSLLLYCLIGLAATDTPVNVEIEVDGKLYAKYNLSEITTPKIIEINTQFGNNTLKIFSDGAEMTDSDCKDRLDVKCGKITKVGQIIVCIPNRITVKLCGNDEEKVDKVTY